MIEHAGTAWNNKGDFNEDNKKGIRCFRSTCVVRGAARSDGNEAWGACQQAADWADALGRDLPGKPTDFKPQPDDCLIYLTNAVKAGLSTSGLPEFSYRTVSRFLKLALTRIMINIKQILKEP